MKLELGVGRTLDGPDAETIALSLAELDWEEDIFAKLSRDERNYIQATGNHREHFIVEYQDGSEERFFQASEKVNIEAVKSAFVAYSRGDSSWQSSFRWQRVDPQVNRGRLRAVLTVIGVIVLIAFFFFLAITGSLAKLHRLRH
jgi:hypothetical protein